MKNLLIYNLGRRGFFSEINNMILAEIYAERYHLRFVVNSFYWNCRYKKGLRDYFDNEIIEQNNIFSAQITRNRSYFDFKVTNLHTLFYNINYIFNTIYSFLHKNVVLGADVYGELRTESFLNTIDAEKYLLNLKKCLRLKTSILNHFDLLFDKLGIDEPFLGIHIRRGDKIATGEMNDISLDLYIEEIIHSRFRTVYIASDDKMSIDYIKAKIIPMGIDVHCNPNLEGEGFNEGNFNNAGRIKRYEDTLILLFDIYVLSRASYFIGTYTSNLSRVIPCFLGFENCKSLDENWHIG